MTSRQVSQRSLLIYGFETSNNLKVRVALEHKGIPYEFRSIEPGDRKELLRVSGQHLTPTMVHGDTVLFDSAAILRYLDANFPDTPKLFGSSHAEQWEIEDWERFGHGRLAEPMMNVVHARVVGHELDGEQKEAAAMALARAARELEARLEGRDWIVGDVMSAADITCGAVIYRIRSGKLLPWPDGCSRCEDLADRIMARLD